MRYTWHNWAHMAVWGAPLMLAVWLAYGGSV